MADETEPDMDALPVHAASERGEPLLEIQNLRIEATVYPPGEEPRQITIVDDVSLSLQKGKVLGLIGESGAGKSTIGVVGHGLRPRRRQDHRRRGHHQRPRHPEGRQAWAEKAARQGSLLCRAVGGGGIQPRAQADGPGGRGHRRARRRLPRRGGKARQGTVPRTVAARSRSYRRPLSAPGFRRTAAARDDGDGAVLGTRPDRLRRADHRARRDDADRRAGGDQEGDPRHRRRRPLHHPRSGGRRPGLRRDHGAAPRQARRMGRNAPDHQGTAQGIHQRAGFGSPDRAPGTRAG